MRANNCHSIGHPSAHRSFRTLSNCWAPSPSIIAIAVAAAFLLLAVAPQPAAAQYRNYRYRPYGYGSGYRSGGPAGYTFCASENSTCSFSGTMSVAYGVGSSWTYQTLSDGTPCTNTVFGNPDPGVLKACYTESSSSDSGSGTGSSSSSGTTSGSDAGSTGSGSTSGSGSGTPSTLLLSVSPTSLAFGSVTVGSGVTQQTTLTNTGTGAVSISNVSVAGAGVSVSGVSPGQTLNPGDTVSVSVTFDPAGAGAVSGGVTITSTAADSPTTISLTGTGAATVVHQVSLSWTASTSQIAGYNVYDSQTNGGPYAKVNSSPVTGTTYTDSNVVVGDTYFFCVTAVNSSNVESSCSNQATAVVP